MTGSDDIPAAAPSSAFDRVRAQRAARDPRRPGERCRAAPGSFAPRVDLTRCEGKGACVAVCPYAVFEVKRIEDADFRSLSFLGRLKSRVHGRLAAYTPQAASCQACGLCVVACPEDAIALVQRGAA